MPDTRLQTLLAGDVLSVAAQLPGWTLRSTVGGVITAVTITETEAYAGAAAVFRDEFNPSQL